MTSISGVSISQWLASTNVSEANSQMTNTDKQNAGSSTMAASGDMVTISEEARQKISEQSATGDSQTEGDTASNSSAGGAGGTGGAFGASAESSTQEQIEELEQKIEELGQKIAQLQGKASSDPSAKTQLDAKLNELAQLQTQLAELKQQQS